MADDNPDSRTKPTKLCSRSGEVTKTTEQNRAGVESNLDWSYGEAEAPLIDSINISS